MKKESIKLLEESMRYSEIVELVQEASEEMWYKIPDVTSFEHTCYTNIGRELLKGKVKSIEAMSKYYIRRAEARHVKLTRYEKEASFSELSTFEEDSEIEFEPEDVLADVEEEVVTKEMTALLAQDDQRKKVILGSWLDGNQNNASISRFLAKTIGGNEETHRKAINRFRIECRELLAAI